MDDIRPEPASLTPTQAMRWREASRALAFADGLDINALRDSDRTLAFGKLRSALSDMMSLLDETAHARDGY